MCTIPPCCAPPPCGYVWQVWQRSIPAAAAALLPPLYQAGPALQEAGDVLLGAAGVDLGLLRVLPALEGWYNLEDGEGGVRGQVKVGAAGVTHSLCGDKGSGHDKAVFANNRVQVGSRWST